MIENKTHLDQFLPKQFLHLSTKDKIEYKGHKLKTCYIINLINELIVKYYFTNELYFNLYSLLLRKKYTHLYNFYLEYVVDHNFLTRVSKHYVGKKACTFKINEEFLKDTVRVKIYDKVLLKKHNKDYIEDNITDFVKSPIPVDIRRKLVSDLFCIKLDYDRALEYLDTSLKNEDIDDIKYNKNFCSIENINVSNIFYKFDSYGRIHTNFTVLKKDIRTNYLSIGGESLCEVDIKNSQPFFLSILMRQEMIPEKLESKELQRYFDLVKLGLVYDDMQQKFPELNSRDEAKKLVYKVFFGPNRENKKECMMFRRVYPEIYDFISEYKSINNNYRSISHMLQYMESKFIFQDVIREIMDKRPDIILFTVHDSIMFQCKHKPMIDEIFERKLNELW